MVGAGIEAEEGLHHHVEAGLLLHCVWLVTVRPLTEVEKSDYLLFDSVLFAIGLFNV